MKNYICIMILLLVCSVYGQSFVSHANLDQDFCDSSVLVVMEKHPLALTRGFTSNDFGGIEIESVEDLIRKIHCHKENVINQIIKIPEEK